MTEAQWLGATEVAPMRKFLEGQRQLADSWRRRVWEHLGYQVFSLTHRQATQFAAACCRQLWPPLVNLADSEAMEAVESFADGNFPSQNLQKIKQVILDQLPPVSSGRRHTSIPDLISFALAGGPLFAQDMIYGDGWSPLNLLTGGITARIASELVPLLPTGEPSAEWKAACAAAAKTQADLLRDIVGPRLFRTTKVCPSWRTSTAIALARKMYESRDYSLMPILADALQDAGCDNQDILNHCRGSGPHVRGCWVVDQLLEKV